MVNCETNLDYNRKYSRVELDLMEPLDVYKVVLNSKYNKCFPRGFWEGEDGKSKAITIIKWLIEEHLNLTREDLLEIVSSKFFAKYKLRGMLFTIFRDSPIDAIMTSYPSKFKAWEFNRTPWNYWNIENSIEAIKWLIEDKFNFNEEDIKTKCSSKFFKSNNLGGMLDTVFNGSSVLAITTAYPNRFKPWELLHCPRNYWNKESAILATKWLIEEKLNVDLDSYEVKRSDFISNGLAGMIRTLYNRDFRKALYDAYPNKFMK